MYFLAESGRLVSCRIVSFFFSLLFYPTHALRGLNHRPVYCFIDARLAGLVSVSGVLCARTTHERIIGTADKSGLAGAICGDRDPTSTTITTTITTASTTTTALPLVPIPPDSCLSPACK